MQDEITAMELDEQMEELNQQLPNTGFLDIAVVQPDGTADYTDGSQSQLGERDYIKKAMEGQANISDVIISKVTGEPVVMVAVPIKKGDHVVGALIGRMDGNTLSNITKDTGYGEKGYAYMINNAGQVIAHPKKELVLEQYNPVLEAEEDAALKSLSDAEKIILEKRSGIIEYQYDGADLYAGYSEISQTNWVIVVTADKEEAFVHLDVLKNRMLLLIISGLVISIISVFVIGSLIAKPIIQMAGLSKKIASLNISDDVPVKYRRMKDENGILAQALQDITDSLRKIIGEITDSAVSVTSTAQELTATAEQSASASEEVSKTVEEIAKGASDQAANTEKGSILTLKY
jgi:methyl-accepting chemotaxis protein